MKALKDEKEAARKVGVSVFSAAVSDGSSLMDLTFSSDLQLKATMFMKIQIPVKILIGVDVSSAADESERRLTAGPRVSAGARRNTTQVFSVSLCWHRFDYTSGP